MPNCLCPIDDPQAANAFVRLDSTLPTVIGPYQLARLPLTGRIEWTWIQNDSDHSYTIPGMAAEVDFTLVIFMPRAPPLGGIV